MVRRCCSAAARCPALCWAWSCARTCGAPCRPPPSTHWRARPSLQTFLPAMRPWVRRSTAAHWWQTSLPGCCAATCTPRQGTAKAPPTWCLPGMTSSPRTAAFWRRLRPLRATTPRPSWTASAWRPSVPATPALSTLPRATSRWNLTYHRRKRCSPAALTPHPLCPVTRSAAPPGAS